MARRRACRLARALPACTYLRCTQKTPPSSLPPPSPPPRQIYVERGLPYRLAHEVAEVLTEKDVIRAHARDELGIGALTGHGSRGLGRQRLGS